MIKLPVFKKKKFSYFCISLNEGSNCKIFLGLHRLPDPPTVFGTNLTCLPTLTSRFVWITPNIQQYFPNHWSIQVFFTVREVSKYGVISGPNTGKHGPEIPPYLDTFHAVLTSGIGPDILMNLLEDRIASLIWAASVLFNFYLKEKQGFSVWGFTKNTSFMSFHRGIWWRYSEINKIKTRKDLSSQK